ncbi:hypothetical protein SAMN06264364_10544 [Quadrisphaera granulorum]|uniref:Uncharacterized protein n=1 Tax=Quadrisphaera granulorum TaxID=317664 RepID=A0A316ACY7_9ACTN|nr:hypothetical protein [Quadrisphaera granulorum]PWJ54840.1 hypothetical protein BXY45_10544 [Quadrisphaera granulorum]SZE95786.1 hypothetical protein SAMN06264364_10544 [Quadrisphaera granulorum]
MHQLHALLLTTLTALSDLTSPAERSDRERGDVPGWVLVTVMSAGIVVGLAAIAAPTLTTMFEQSIKAVKVAAP